MTPHPLKTVEEKIQNVQMQLSFSSMARAGDPSQKQDMKHEAMLAGELDLALVALRAIMGQDVESLKNDFDFFYHTRSTVIHNNENTEAVRAVVYAWIEKSELASTGRICGVPDGWVMVPREPTEEMLEAAWNFCDTHNAPTPGIIYKIMVGAASTPGGGDE